MARDYARQRRRARNNSAHGVFWLLAGLVLGLIIAAFFYLKQQPMSSSHKKPKVLHAKSHAGTTAKKASKVTVSEVAQSDDTAQEQQPEFDFYTILPKVKVPASAIDSASAGASHKTVKNLSKNTVTEVKSPLDAANIGNNKAAVTAINKPQATERKVVHSAALTSSYILQIAAFSHYADADQLKAQLILLGFEPNLKTVQKSGINWYRVWLGPYSQMDDVQKVQGRLQANHVKSVIVKES